MNAILTTIDKTHSSVLDGTHPHILGTMKAKAANGILKEGLLVAKDSSGDLVAYNPLGVSPVTLVVAVLIHDIDTASDDAAVVIKHGTVNKAKLLVGSAAPDAADIAALEAKTIYAL